jgi:membrane-bound lytic murein transglycosylase D
MSLALTQAVMLVMQQTSLRPALSANAQESTQPAAAAVATEGTQSPVVLRTKADFTALLVTTLPRFDIDPTRLPSRFRKRLAEHLHVYTVRSRTDVQNMLARAARYLPTIRLILQEHGLPWYYAYLPLVESAFHIDAMHPKTGAAGLWQLMSFTARGYGLRITNTLDERLEPARATRAAAGYLRELRDMFGATSPLLLLAAYNYGENNLSKAITRARTRDIWQLYLDRHLPYQTRHYLVKMVALWIVVANADDFRFTLKDAIRPLAYTEMTFSQPVSLATLSRRVDMPVDRLHAINPHLLRAEVPAGAPVRIPAPHLHKSVHVEVRLTSSDPPGRAKLLLLDTPPLQELKMEN